MCSQAVQCLWMKDGYSDLYEQIVEQVRSERWEPVGGMWVEPGTQAYLADRMGTTQSAIARVEEGGRVQPRDT